eukprot:TRINITY_DN5837_c0_g1_i1.p1 TRINITY_DN5837_c0_g1~~TRINITY_DN5837_c0_g1_i1.p1  ORF type:complete len:749 (+),score=178.22 TRINITY_DN5837_c0_g1_i1:72-2249(+)
MDAHLTTPRGFYSQLNTHEDEAVSDHLMFDPSQLSMSEGKRRASIGNLDKFFIKVYRYFTGKGFWALFVSKLLNLMAFLFIIFFSTAVLGLVDWQSFVADPKQGLDIMCTASSVRPCQPSLFLGVYFAILCVVWLVQLYFFVVDVKDAIIMWRFFSHKLGLSERDMHTIKWAEVVQRIESLQDVERLSVTKDKLDAQDIVSRIMRKENYLIAMFNADIINTSIPLLKVGVLTKVLEWNLLRVLDLLFDADLQVDQALLSVHNQPERARKLRLRFLLFGLINFLLMPVVLVFSIVFLILRYGEEVHSSPGAMLGARQWTPLALWQFREYNELPHVFKRRMRAGYKPADQYLQLFPSKMLQILGRFVAFIFGSLSAVLIMLALIDDDALTAANIGGRNLLWYLAVFGGALAVCRAVTVEEDPAVDPEKAMRRVALHTHYFPETWRHRCHSYDAVNEFSGLFQLRVVSLVMEVLSVLLVPFIMWFSLPKCADAIVSFIHDYTVDVRGVGRVCHFSTWDFKNLGDVNFGAHVDPTSLRRPRLDLRNGGKMEKSFVNFTAQHPHWHPSAEGQNLLDTLVARSRNTAGANSMFASTMGTGLVGASQHLGMGRSHVMEAAARSVLSDSVIYTPDQIFRDLPPHAALYPLLDNYREQQHLVHAYQAPDPSSRPPFDGAADGLRITPPRMMPPPPFAGTEAVGSAEDDGIPLQSLRHMQQQGAFALADDSDEHL